MRPASSSFSTTDAAPARQDAATAAMAAARAHQRVHTDSVQLFLSYWRGPLFALAIVTVVVIVLGQRNAPLHHWLAWGAFAGANCLGQAAVCLAMERSASLEQAIRRWMPALLASIFLNGVAWGLLPWMVSDAPTHVLVLACLFIAMLLFCIVNSPGTLAMNFAAAPPMAIVGTAALLSQGLWLAGSGFLALVAVIAVYGFRLRRALTAGLAERRAAEDLAVDLRTHQQRLLHLERERTLLIERERLMRDMHDGLGSALVASLAAVQRGDVDRDQLATILGDCVDDLRSVIDSLDPVDSDLAALLATLRLRLERRLEASGVRLEWQMGVLPKLLWLGPSEALHILRIVQELLNNVARHAGASRVSIGAAHVGEEVEVRVADDGRGFDPRAVMPGRGMGFLKQRAAAIGGTLRIESAPGAGAVVTLRLPVSLERRGAEGDPQRNTLTA